ncbi:hypothetical protein WL21_32565 [Burkholderia ubonensis]|uniref:hypothetical protein n=1 Tax=Burkholderia ubonensis TaxID=101571 RepID=UPI000752D028|nr:hypothetical protein [Burkholderia ubonensis]KVO95539.1 hypothetical protein WJ81_02700 [Burkholderia ubonensis]KVZ58462.1 hypothetical protein WL20_22350 [Burkholderia ubonensis]KVZ75144.1 hypothetical protein WL21_32565 [Burkholderia ubonensis]
MSAKAMPWFRMYTDFLNDPKMISLAFEDQRHFIGLLALKGDGTLDNKCAPELMNRIVAQRLWIDYAVVGEVKKRLVAAGLIDDEWQPLAWERRQMRSDADPTNAERQRRHRQKKKADSDDSNGSGNDAANADSNALRNEQVTNLDTDTDTEEEKETEKDKTQTHARKRGADVSDSADEKPLDAKALVAEGVQRQHAVDWLALRKAKRLPLTPTAWGDVKDEATKCGMTPAAAVEHAVKQNWAGFKAKWLIGDQPSASRSVPSGAPLNKQEQLEANNRAVAQRAAERFQAQQGATQ